MRTLVSTFELKEAVSQESFEMAWADFRAALANVSPDTRLSRLLARVPSSDYDTDTERQHSFLTTITFPEAEEADRIWNVMEDSGSGLSKAHVAMLRLTKDQLFTFWASD